MPDVLVIEDNLTMREGLVITLSKMGLDTTGVADGESALQLLSQKEFDLVVTDLTLAGLSGI